MSVYFIDNEIGGLLLDLGGPVSAAKINVYSWHMCMNEGFSDPLRAAHRERAAQNYVLYGFGGDEPPERGESPAESGWTLISRVNSDDYFGLSGVQRPTQQASSISSARGSLGRFRHLLWIVQPTSGRNHDGSDQSFDTFFGEIDVYAAEWRSGWRHHSDHGAADCREPLAEERITAVQTPVGRFRRRQ